MRTGFPPKPPQIQLAEGDPRKIGKKKLRERIRREVQATRGLPECPKHVLGLAREVWEFWVRELEYMDLDRRPDAVMLEGAVVNYARAVSADAILEVEGITVKTPVTNRVGDTIGHRITKHPAVSVSRDSWSMVRSFCIEFGLTPAARTRLPLRAKPAETVDLMKILSAPRKSREQLQ